MKAKSYYIVLCNNRPILETLGKGHAWYCAAMSGTKLVRVTKKGHIIEAWERKPAEFCSIETHMWFKVA